MKVKLLVLLLMLSTSLNAGAPSHPALSCPEVPGLAPLLKPGHVVLLGEMHGTNESPQFLSDALCVALQNGHSVTVGLELPLSETERANAFLESSGDAEAELRLLKGSFWLRDFQDGRTSHAMLALLRDLRQYKAAGWPLRVILIDDPAAPKRDRVMRAQIQTALAASPDDVLLVLTGNLHNRLTQGTRWDATYEPMGFLLRQSFGEKRLFALNVAHEGGQAWVCFGSSPSDCGIKQIGGKAREGQGVTLFATPDGQAYHGHYHVGRLTASPPAVGSFEDH